MATPIEFQTPRLRVRQWSTEDCAPFAALNADPQLMRYFASVGTPETCTGSVASAGCTIAADDAARAMNESVRHR